VIYLPTKPEEGSMKNKKFWVAAVAAFSAAVAASMVYAVF
jgi:hypothetical protein